MNCFGKGGGLEAVSPPSYRVYMQQAQSYVNKSVRPTMRKRGKDNIKKPNLLEFRDVKKFIRENIEMELSSLFKTLVLKEERSWSS
jgi:hypothetical protein